MEVKNKKTIVNKIVAIFAYLFLTFGIIACGVGIYTCYQNNIYYSEGNYENSVMFTNKVNSYIYSAYEQANYYSDTYDEYGYSTGQINMDVLLEQMDANLQLVNLNYKIYLDDKLVYTHLNGNQDQELTNYYTIEQWNSEDEVSYIEVYYTINKIKDSDDYFSTDANLYNLLYKWRYNFIFIIAILCLLLVIDIIYLCVMVGRENVDDNAKLNELDKIPFELYVGIICGLLALAYMALGNIYFYGIVGTAISGLYLALVMLAGLSVLLTFVNRIKCGNFFGSTILYNGVKFIWIVIVNVYKVIRDLVVSIPFIWKSIVFIIVFILIIPMNIYYRWYFFLYLVAISGYVLYFSYNLAQIKQQTKKIAKGDFQHHLNTRFMIPELKDYSDNLDSINNGLSLALDEKMHSERLKTELITNVSHDIKTPLTSIVNYVDLLKRDPDEKQKQEYLAILDKQTKRLKKLTEDIVEFSKVSTGNIKLNKEINHGNELLKQAIGEYEEILEKNDLELVCQFAEGDCEILTDGKYVWRVLDNCLNNAVKYSKKNTRVYVDSQITDTDFIVTIKNISEKMLNVPVKELLERFARGDSSRNTEGSGLGLSIASDLTNLLGGKFDIEIDGDLFKVIFSLPINK